MENQSECPHCYGCREVSATNGLMHYTKICPLCEGKGKVTQAMLVSYFELPDK